MPLEFSVTEEWLKQQDEERAKQWYQSIGWSVLICSDPLDLLIIAEALGDDMDLNDLIQLMNQLKDER